MKKQRNGLNIVIKHFYINYELLILKRNTYNFLFSSYSIKFEKLIRRTTDRLSICLFYNLSNKVEHANENRMTFPNTK